MKRKDSQKIARRLRSSKLIFTIAAVLLVAQSLWDIWVTIESRIAFSRWMSDSRYADNWISTLDRIDSGAGPRALLRILFLAALVFWTYWSHRFTTDVMGETRKWGRGWAIAGWFVPIAFFFVPILVTQETERIATKLERRTYLSPLWWVSSWISIISFRAVGEWLTTSSESSTADFSQYYSLSFVGFGTLLISIGFAYFLISDIYRGLNPEAALDEVSLIAAPDLATKEGDESELSRLSSPESVAERIRTLTTLYLEGHLTTEEFEIKKKKLINEI